MARPDPADPDPADPGADAGTGRFAVLAVCTANICRSPLIEALLRDRLDRDVFEVASAGTRGWDQQPMDAMAAMELMRLGLRPGTFRSHPIDGQLVESAGLILTAARVHRSEILSSAPQALRRTFTLREFALLVPTVDAPDLETLVAEAARARGTVRGPLDVDDPYRRSPEVHRGVADQIDEACRIVADRLNDVAGRSATT